MTTVHTTVCPLGCPDPFSLAVTVVMQALNQIHDVEEHRPLLRRGLTAVALAASVGALVIGALIVMSAAAKSRPASWISLCASSS